MNAIGWVVSFIVAAICSCILRGYTLSILWGWFVVETFKVPPLNIPVAIGLSLIVGYLTHQPSEDNQKKDPKEVFCRGIAVSIVYPALALLTGWIVTLFM